MKIIRGKQEFNLTKKELLDAYLEQEHLFDIQDIKNNMSLYLDEEEYEKLKNNNVFIEEAAGNLRRNQDKYNMDYECAIKKAIIDARIKYISKESEDIDRKKEV